jgi:hypothetical protein
LRVDDQTMRGIRKTMAITNQAEASFFSVTMGEDFLSYV